MSEFGDRFFGGVAIVCIILYVVFIQKHPVHVYDAVQERAVEIMACVVNNMPEEGYTDGQYDKAKAVCSAREDRKH